MNGLGLSMWQSAIRNEWGTFGAGASLNLDFTSGNQTLDPRITFSRASSATRTNSAGVLELVSTDGPRFDYDPVTLQPKGLLIEEQRTNLLLQSLIDGTPLATQSVVLTSQAYMLSFYGTGTVTISGMHSAVVDGLGAYPSRKTYTFTVLSGAVTFTVTGDVKYAQVEAGSFATSYIPTTTAAATRAADVAVMTGANFSNWYNQSEGTLFVGAFTPPNLAAFPTIVAISDGSTNNQATQYAHTSGYYSNIRSGGVVQGDPGRVASPVTGTPYKFAVGLIADNAIGAVNGTTGTPDTSLLMPVGVNQMRIGTNTTGGAIINTHISHIAYWPRRLTNAELQGVTA